MLIWYKSIKSGRSQGGGSSSHVILSNEPMV